MLQTSSVYEAGLMGKCLKLCESLGINEFDFKGLTQVIDLRPSLGSDECMVTQVSDPECFVVIRREGSYLSPLVEIDNELMWAFEDGATDYANNPVILEANKVHIFSTRKGD